MPIYKFNPINHQRQRYQQMLLDKGWDDYDYFDYQRHEEDAYKPLSLAAWLLGYAGPDFKLQFEDGNLSVIKKVRKEYTEEQLEEARKFLDENPEQLPEEHKPVNPAWFQLQEAGAGMVKKNG